MQMYQDGIARFMIQEPGADRFRIAEQPILTEGVDLRPQMFLDTMVAQEKDDPEACLELHGSTSYDSDKFRY